TRFSRDWSSDVCSSDLAAWRSYAELRRALAGRRFDLVLNLQVYMKAGIITSMMPADVKVGFDRRRARDLNWLFTTHRIPPRPLEIGRASWRGRWSISES